MAEPFSAGPGKARQIGRHPYPAAGCVARSRPGPKPTAWRGSPAGADLDVWVVHRSHLRNVEVIIRPRPGHEQSSTVLGDSRVVLSGTT